jgi:hypothetical protein
MQSRAGQPKKNDGESADDKPDPDQLVKYWQGMKVIHPEILHDHKTVIYLTSHAIPPVEELAETLNRKKEMRLGWLSCFGSA